MSSQNPSESNSTLDSNSSKGNSTFKDLFKSLNPPRFGDENDVFADSEARYAAYASRIGQLAKVASQSPVASFAMGFKRYLAYTSDVGEAFRPVVPSGLVRACYGISWAYVLGDVGNESYKAWKATNDSKEVLRHGSQQLVFNAMASMILPMFLIHSVVHQTEKTFSKSKNATLKRVAPSAAGLLLIPALPFLFDKSVEIICEKLWDYAWPEYKYKPHHANDSSSLNSPTDKVVAPFVSTPVDIAALPVVILSEQKGESPT
eukprot:GDKJ01010870.1.p1 GENE.GDKJ01010870.1~~GDKJ01010870.1.p1  ORF type:complete len:261 (+),score=51.13 GDKJ01010870.1:32-814(+)